MAQCFRSLGELDSALTIYHGCFILAESLQDWIDLSSVWAEMGQVSCEKGAYEKALPFYQKSLELAIKPNNYWNIAATYLDMGRYKEAKRNFLNALTISQKKGIKEFEATSLYYLGQLHYSNGTYDSARIYGKGPRYLSAISGDCD